MISISGKAREALSYAFIELGQISSLAPALSLYGRDFTAIVEAMKSGKAIERLDARINAMESMVESLKAGRPVIDALYKTLSDDQKKKADLLLGMGCCMVSHRGIGRKYSRRV